MTGNQRILVSILPFSAPQTMHSSQPFAQGNSSMETKSKIPKAHIVESKTDILSQMKFPSASVNSTGLSTLILKRQLTVLYTQRTKETCGNPNLTQLTPMSMFQMYRVKLVHLYHFMAELRKQNY